MKVRISGPADASELLNRFNLIRKHITRHHHHTLAPPQVSFSLPPPLGSPGGPGVGMGGAGGGEGGGGGGQAMLFRRSSSGACGMCKGGRARRFCSPLGPRRSLSAVSVAECTRTFRCTLIRSTALTRAPTLAHTNLFNTGYGSNASTPPMQSPMHSGRLPSNAAAVAALPGTSAPASASYSRPPPAPPQGPAHAPQHPPPQQHPAITTAGSSSSSMQPESAAAAVATAAAAAGGGGGGKPPAAASAFGTPALQQTDATAATGDVATARQRQEAAAAGEGGGGSAGMGAGSGSGNAAGAAKGGSGASSGSGPERAPSAPVSIP